MHTKKEYQAHSPQSRAMEPTECKTKFVCAVGVLSFSGAFVSLIGERLFVSSATAAPGGAPFWCSLPSAPAPPSTSPSAAVSLFALLNRVRPRRVSTRFLILTSRACKAGSRSTTWSLGDMKEFDAGSNETDDGERLPAGESLGDERRLSSRVSESIRA